MSFVDPNTPDNVLPDGMQDRKTGEGLKLVFSDEFNAPELDTKKWTARDQNRGKGNNGVEWWYKPDNVRKATGNDALAIDIKKSAITFIPAAELILRVNLILPLAFLNVVCIFLNQWDTLLLRGFSLRLVFQRGPTLQPEQGPR